MQFSQKIDGVWQKDSQGFSNSYKVLYKQNPFEKFLIFTIYQNYTLALNIVQQDQCFISKLDLEIEHAKSNLKTPISQIWVICHLLPFVRVGQLKENETLIFSVIVLIKS